MGPTTPFWVLLLPIALMGVANGFMWAPISTSATRNLPMGQAGAGAGVYNTTRQVGAVLGSAGIAALMQARLVGESCPGRRAAPRPPSRSCRPPCTPASRRRWRSRCCCPPRCCSSGSPPCSASPAAASAAPTRSGTAGPPATDCPTGVPRRARSVGRVLAAVPPPVTVRVPAKINLHLAVGPLRERRLPRPRHRLPRREPVRRGHGRGDRAPGHRGARRGRQRRCRPTTPTSPGGRSSCSPSAPTGDPDVPLVLRKGIPVAGGMAGGSADAAGALVGLSALWKLDLSRDELSGSPRELGSDVTFALHGGTALGTGRGEQIVPVLSRHPQHWVIALHRGGLSTPAVFGELDRLARRPPAAAAARRAGAGGPGGRRPAPARPLPGQRPAGRGRQPGARAAPHPAGGRRRGRAGRASSPGSGPTCAFLCAGADARVDVATELAGVGRVPHRPGRARPGARRPAWSTRTSPRPLAGRRCTPDAQRPQNLVNLETVTAHVPGDASRVLLDARLARRRAGDRIGVVGLNGGGKTTLLDILAGARAPRRGPGQPGRRAAAGAPRAGRRPARRARGCATSCSPRYARRARVGGRPAGARRPGRARRARPGLAPSTGCPAARSGGWRWPRRWSATRTWSCSTSRPTTSTSRASAGWPST